MSVFIIAEISANHNNDLDLALKTVQAAIDSGADAIKVQTFKPESLALDVDNEIFGPKKQGAWKGWRPWDLYQKAALPYEWHIPIKELVESSGKVFFSSPFDLDAVDFLESLKVPLYKIASFEINDIPLISKVASTGKPIIISTGVAGLDEIEQAVEACHFANNFDITLLKCTSEYPAKISEANLNKMLDLKKRFPVKVGLSDHSEGFIVPIVATSLGAEVIEKHFILDRSNGGLDSVFSMEPAEFSQMVDLVRSSEKALGNVSYDVSENDQYRKRSLFAISPIRRGEVFTAENVKSLRPNIGLAPLNYYEIINKKATQNIEVGAPLKQEHIE
ncbi:pseudaminic acid synthase [Thiomicrorhabdus sp. Milos-T2]|uniref:pseudaminic acid synthase n=1 Tax=Thiomicrorhabdus sp. Milos-T2 TaxID=90814 RepID=UPI0004947CA2|nr:pseudaminic acid synthase [Thiomicrorhabdus sp. Milos-T2]